MLIALLIVAPAAYPALTIWSSNDILPKAYRFVVVAAVFVLIGIAVFLLVNRRISDSRISAFITFFVILVLASFGQILSRWSWGWRWVVAGVALTVSIVIVLRLRNLWLLDLILIAGAAALFFPPLLTGVWNSLTGEEAAPLPPPAAEVPEMVARPDIFLVIVDGYTSLAVLRALFGFEDPDLEADLAADQFQIIEPMFSGYSITQFSLPALLQMDFLPEGRLVSTTSERLALAKQIGGDNQLVDMLASNGYRMTMVEPGWHLSTCGDAVDSCVVDPFIDDGVGAVLSQSMLWSLLESSVGSPYTHSSRHSMSETLDGVAGLLDNGSPDFMFVHVLAPHPPLQLDAECQVDFEPTMGGTDMGLAAVSPETGQARLQAYVNQVKCVNRFVRQLTAELSGTDSVSLITGDHGSDALGQFSIEPELWTDPQILERMSVFTIVKVPPGCSAKEPLVTVPLFRSVIACSGGVDIDPIEDHAYVVPQYELGGRWPEPRFLESEEVARLADCLAEIESDLSCDPS